MLASATIVFALVASATSTPLATPKLPADCRWCPADGCGTGIQPPFSTTLASCSVDIYSKPYDPVGTATAISKVPQVKQLELSVNIAARAQDRATDASMAEMAAALSSANLDELKIFIGGLRKVTPDGLVSIAQLNPTLRSNLRSLNLGFEFHGVGDANIEAMGASLGSMAKLENLAIDISSYNASSRSVSGRGVNGFFRMLNVNPAKRTLKGISVNLKSNKAITDSDLGSIGQSIATLETFTSVGLGLDQLSLTDKGVGDLIHSLHTKNGTMTSLSLSLNDNGVTDAGLNAIVAVAAKMGRLTELKTYLDGQVPGGDITVSGVEAASTIISKSGVKNWSLGLSENADVTPSNAKAMASALAIAGSKVAGSVDVGSWSTPGDPTQPGCDRTYSATYDRNRDCILFGFRSNGGPAGACARPGDPPMQGECVSATSH